MLDALNNMRADCQQASDSRAAGEELTRGVLHRY
jgi:hypothetical protein